MFRWIRIMVHQHSESIQNEVFCISERWQPKHVRVLFQLFLFFLPIEPTLYLIESILIENCLSQGTAFPTKLHERPTKTMTKTRLFKYIENFFSKNFQIFS